MQVATILNLIRFYTSDIKSLQKTVKKSQNSLFLLVFNHYVYYFLKESFAKLSNLDLNLKFLFKSYI